MLQGDGNLVVYTTSSPVRSIWSAGTQGRGGVRLCMQNDGNLVLYRANNTAVWSTGTMYPGAYAEMQFDGQLAIWQNGISRYASGPQASCVTTTASATTPIPTRACNIGLAGGECMFLGDVVSSCQTCFKLVLQDDGNLVIYPTVDSVKSVWASFTQGKGAVKACMQDDGNFVLYTATDAPVWSTKTSNYPGAYLEMQFDGQLVIWQNGISRYSSGPTAQCVSP